MSRRKRLTCKTPAARGARNRKLAHSLLRSASCHSTCVAHATNVVWRATCAGKQILPQQLCPARKQYVRSARNRKLAHSFLRGASCHSTCVAHATNVVWRATCAGKQILPQQLCPARKPYVRSARHVMPHRSASSKLALNSIRGGQMYRAPGASCRSSCAPHAKTGDPLPNLPGRPYFPDPATADRTENNPYI